MSNVYDYVEGIGAKLKQKRQQSWLTRIHYFHTQDLNLINNTNFLKSINKNVRHNTT